MNPLLSQFLSESRGLLENCSDTFLQLEQAPQNNDILNSLFRYVHTIKGGSGLFDIPDFTRLVHVSEDSLSKAREGELVITSDGIDIYFRVIDQLNQWLDALERNECLDDDSSSQSDELVSLIESRILNNASTDDADALSDKADTNPLANKINIADLLAGVQEDTQKSLLSFIDNVDKNVSVIVYTPNERAFFSGDDPISYWQQLPTLLWQSIELLSAPSDVASYDPFDCAIKLIGVTDADQNEVNQALSYVIQEVAIVNAKDIEKTTAIGDSNICEPARHILSSQYNLLMDIKENKNPNASIASVERVLKALSERETALGTLPSLLTQTGELNSAFLKAVEPLINQDSVNAIESEKSETVETKKLAPTDKTEKVEPTKNDTIKTVKVDQDKLEQLVDLTGELIVAKNSLQHLARKVETEYGIKSLTRDLKSEHGVLNRISESLQDVVMQIRMIPVSSIFQRFPRLVRDLSRKLDKKIDLQIVGEDTEADKNIVEQLADPLIHLVRNSIDHGIESAEIRRQSNKLDTGTIKLIAKSLDDSVIIEIHDDGAGICPQNIRDKAVEKGVITPEQASVLSDKDALQLIFAPGFSTKEEVSELSGRGVGMDVVKTTVASLGGNIDLHSTLGEGSVVKIALPASITVSRVMMFEIEEQVYGIPVEGLTETIKIDIDRVQRIKRGEAYMLRKHLIPLYRMHKILGIRQQKDEEVLPILNLNINGSIAGFVVDKLLEGVDVIIKPLEGLMARFPIYSGAAVLGDGRVLLVINPKEMSLCH